MLSVGSDEMTVLRWRIIVAPYEDQGKYRWLRDRRWQWTRERVYTSGRVSLEKQGYASTIKAARKSAMRGLVYEWAGSKATRSEMVYAIETPSYPRTDFTPGPLSPRLLEEDIS